MAEALFLKKDFIYLRQREGETEGEKLQCAVASCTPPTGDLTWPSTQACALKGSRTGDPSFCRPALNPLSHTSQGKTSLAVPREVYT